MPACTVYKSLTNRYNSEMLQKWKFTCWGNLCQFKYAKKQKPFTQFHQHYNENLLIMITF